jgi:hypothetical protein
VVSGSSCRQDSVSGLTLVRAVLDPADTVATQSSGDRCAAVTRRLAADQLTANRRRNMSNADIRALNEQELETISGAALANPTFRLVLFGYGFEFNSRTACVITPGEDVCTNIPQK